MPYSHGAQAHTGWPCKVIRLVKPWAQNTCGAACSVELYLLLGGCIMQVICMLLPHVTLLLWSVLGLSKLAVKQLKAHTVC
jgi:hypothetical protein